MPIFNTMPTFLYPHSRQFPFDEVAEMIVRELKKRNWNVPGITVDFDNYGSGEAKFQHVYHVIGNDFKLTFMRIQEKQFDSTHWNDCAALEKICIPKQQITVYEDESGPTYYLYVGEDWEADKNWFMNAIKIHAKLDGKPRKYLKYRGDYYSDYIVDRYGRAELLVSDTDLNREYAPQGDEPIKFSCPEKLNEFTSWLKENVLQYILRFPEAEVIEFSKPMEKLIPYHETWETFYSVCNVRKEERIQKGKKDIQSLLPEERFALAPSYRLVSLDIPCRNRFPTIAYDGFIWCDVKKIDNLKKNDKKFYEIVNAMASFSDFSFYILEIKPKYANHIYVADNFPYEKMRQQLFRKIAPRNRLTDEEIGNAYAARGATIVPITEYKGGYKEPIVLINRELDFDEVEIIGQMEK